MTGIKNGNIVDWEFASNGDRLDCSVNNFHLRSNSTPHPTYGYFQHLRRVYRVSKCTKASGKCAGCEHRHSLKRKRG